MAFHGDTLRVTDPSVHSHHHHHHHTNLHPNRLKISLRTQTYFHETVKLNANSHRNMVLVNKKMLLILRKRKNYLKQLGRGGRVCLGNPSSEAGGY